MSDEKKALSKIEVPPKDTNFPAAIYCPSGGKLSCWWPTEGPHRLIVRAVYADGASKVWEYLPQHINGPIERCYV